MTINPNTGPVDDTFEIDNGAITFERPVEREREPKPEIEHREDEPDVGDMVDTGADPERQGMQQVEWQQRNAARHIEAWAKAH